MFNFYIELAGLDLLSDAGTTTTCRRKTKPHDDEQKYKNEQSFEKKGFNGKTVWRFQTKKIRKTFSLDEKIPWNTRPLKTIIEYGFCKK